MTTTMATAATTRPPFPSFPCRTVALSLLGWTVVVLLQLNFRGGTVVEGFQGHLHRQALPPAPTVTTPLATTPSLPPTSPVSSSSSSSSKRRRSFLGNLVAAATTVVGTVVAASATGVVSVQSAIAAPPIAVIAEELGYFPVMVGRRGGGGGTTTSNNSNDTVIRYVPKRVKRPSTRQSIELATAMRDAGITMYGAYWCPHCSRQREIFGAQAWAVMDYVECSPDGYNYDDGRTTTGKGNGRSILCNKIDGYPTFRNADGTIQFSGERSLQDLARTIGFADFDPSLEDEIPMPGTTCKLR
jgi:hypothetical protein